MNKILRLFLVLTSFLVYVPLHAQGFRMSEDVELGSLKQTHQLILVDYSKFVGRAWEIDGNELVFQINNAEATSRFPLSEIRYLGVYIPKGTGTKKNKVLFDPEGPKFSDLSYLRTALPTEGKGRIRVLNITYAIAEFNVNNNIQLGVGLLTPVGPLFTQRLRVPITEYLNVGFSLQSTLILIDIFSGPYLAGDGRINLTYGTSERFINFSQGKAYSTLDNDPLVNTTSIGAGGRLGRGWHAYGEIGIFRGRFETSILPALSASNSSNRHRWRFGVFTVLIPDGIILPLPFVGYDYHW